MQLKQIYCVKSNTTGKGMVQLVVLFLILLFLMFGAPILEAQTLKICDKSGTESNWNTTDIQKLTFSSGNLYLHQMNNQTQEFTIQNIRRLLFSDVGSGAVSYKNQNKEGFFIYPNPVHDALTVEFEFPKEKTIQVKIFSLDGRLLLNQTYSSLSPGKVTKRISVNMLSPGIYICRLNDSFNNVSKKFIKK